MSFLAPLMWLGALLAIPVVLFYLVRDEPRRRVVSTLFFWNTNPVRPHEAPRWQKLRRPLSLLLQLLFLILVLAALARPVPPWGERGGKSAVFILDVSASMGATDEGPSRFENAVTALRGEIQRLQAGDQATLLATGDPPRVLVPWTRSKNELLEALNAARPSGQSSDPGEAVLLGTRLADAKSGRVYLFTDAVWAHSPDLPESVDVKIFGEPSRNAGITLLAARRSFLAPGEIQVTAEVAAGVSSDSSGTLQFQLTKEGELVDLRELSLSPGEQWEEAWVFQSEDAATFEARLTGFAGDVLAADDIARMQVPELPVLPIALVSPPDIFWESALNALPRVTVERIWPPIPDGDPDTLWIFRGIVPDPEFSAAGLILSGPETGGFFGSLIGDMPEPVLTEVEPQAGVTRFASLQMVQPIQATEFEPAEGSTTYASSAGRPLIFGNWEGERKWLVLAFDPSRSDLVFKSAIPLLRSNLVQGLRGDLWENHRAPGTSRSLTSLDSAMDSSPARTPAAARISHLALWWWLLAAAVLWVFVEWFTYHRKWTE